MGKMPGSAVTLAPLVGNLTGVTNRTPKDESAPEPRVRLIIDTDEEIRHAIALRVMRLKVRENRRGANQSDAVNAILREALADELAEVRRMSKPKGK